MRLGCQMPEGECNRIMIINEYELSRRQRIKRLLFTKNQFYAVSTEKCVDVEKDRIFITYAINEEHSCNS